MILEYIYKAYNWYLSPDRLLARQLTAVLDYVPVYLHHYKEAFSHRSYNSSSGGGAGAQQNTTYHDNERLEFMGDAILGAITAEYLYKKYPNKDEGFMTMMRSKMVNRRSLNKIASEMSFDIIMRQLGGSNLSESMLGNAFEAFVGAVYLDVGYNRTRTFILSKVIKHYLDVHTLESTNTNYKSQLLEWCQKEKKRLDYKIVKQFKQNRRDRFRIATMIDGVEVAQGEDFSKRSAEQISSREALLKLGLIDAEVS